MNIVALRGRLSRPAEERILGSGTRLVAYEGTVPDRNGGRAETVPVVWFDAPTGALIDTGTDKRYVRRNDDGTFKESTDVGRSSAADQRQHAKGKSKPGQGDKGDR